MRSFLILGLALASAAVSAQGVTHTKSEWKKATLTSRDGVSINVDYQVDYVSYPSNKPSETYSFSPVVINVSGARLKPSDTIQVILVNTMRNLGSCGMGNPYNWQESMRVDLQAAPEGHFYGDLTRNGLRYNDKTGNYSDKVTSVAMIINPYCRTEVSLGQEIAVVINGEWLKDPVNNSSNFKLDLEYDTVKNYR